MIHPVTTKEEPYRAAHRILALTLLEPVNLVGVTTLAHASESDGSCAMSYSASRHRSARCRCHMCRGVSGREGAKATETMASVPKVAAPSLAVATVVPLRTHEEEMVMESLKFVVARALIPSSTKTTKAVMDFPAMAVLCGWVAKASLVA